jgi:hypothetical protein
MLALSMAEHGRHTTDGLAWNLNSQRLARAIQ